MGNTLWFITILQEKPWIGFLIGLAFMALMFGSKNLVIYFYAKNQEKKKQVQVLQSGGASGNEGPSGNCGLHH